MQSDDILALQPTRVSITECFHLNRSDLDESLTILMVVLAGISEIRSRFCCPFTCGEVIPYATRKSFLGRAAY